MLAVLLDAGVSCVFGMPSTTHVHRCVLWRNTPGRLYAGSTCQLSSLECSHRSFCTGVSQAQCFWPFFRQIPLSHTVHDLHPVPAEFRAGVSVSQLIGRVFTSFGLCSHCLFVKSYHIVWAHVVVDVITLMHVRVVWADLIVKHMIFIQLLATWFWVVDMIGLGLLCIRHAHTFYAQDVVRPRVLFYPGLTCLGA